MLDDILEASSQGITLIEEEIGAVSPILARQIATYGNAKGKRVCILDITDQKQEIQQRGVMGIRVGLARDEIESLPEGISSIPLKLVRGTLNLEELKYDLIVAESFSSYLFDKTEVEIVELLKEMRRLATQGRSFVLTSETEMLSSRVNAYIRGMSDNVVILKTEVTRDRIYRLLYIPKMKGIEPMDSPLKFTISKNGLRIDTREFVG